MQIIDAIRTASEWIVDQLVKLEPLSWPFVTLVAIALLIKPIKELLTILARKISTSSEFEIAALNYRFIFRDQESSALPEQHPQENLSAEGEKGYTSRLLERYNSSISEDLDQLFRLLSSPLYHPLHIFVDYQEALRLKRVLDFFEEMATAILTKLAEEAPVRKLLRSVTLNAWPKLQWLILYLRDTEKDNSLYDQFEALCLRWAERK